MKIKLPLVNTSKVKEVMKDNNGIDGLTNTIRDNLKRYNLYKVFSISDFYDMKSALIKAAEATDGVYHIVILDENGFTEWIDYDEESRQSLYEKWKGIIEEDDVIGDNDGYTKEDLIANLYTVLYEDFGFDMYIDEYAVNIGHGVRVDKPDNVFDFVYRYISALYDKQKDMIRNTKDDGRLSTWLGMNAVGLLSETTPLEDLILIDYSVPTIKREYPYEIALLAQNDRSCDISDTYVYLLNYILKASHEFVKGLQNETN